MHQFGNNQNHNDFGNFGGNNQNDFGNFGGNQGGNSNLGNFTNNEANNDFNDYSVIN